MTPTLTAASSSQRTAPRERAIRWLLVALWLLLPFSVGAALAATLEQHSEAVQRADSAILWLVWLAGLIATLVPTTVSLTVVRVMAPATLVAVVWAGADHYPGGIAIAGALNAAAVIVVAFLPAVGYVFVNGSAYGDERRFPLRVPVPLLVGPIELAWIAAVGGAVAGPMLLAAGGWVPGAVLLVLGWPLAFVLGRSFHGLARRWLVFVPAGVVVHDYGSLTESVMVTKRHVASIAPAPATTGTGAYDLTAASAGSPIEVRMTEPTVLSPRPRRRPGTGAVVEPVEASAVVVAPSRPVAVLREALRRGYHP